MRVLIVGAGGVGTAAAAIAARRDFFETMVVAEHDEGRASASVERLADDRFRAAQVDASSADAVTALCRQHAITHVLNAVDPRFVMTVFDGALAAAADYLDMAMSLSHPDPDRPHEVPGVVLGDEQVRAVAGAQLVDLGEQVVSGVAGEDVGEAGLDAQADQGQPAAPLPLLVLGELKVEGYDFAPSFSIWTTIEECLNPPLVWERDRGYFTTEPFSEPEVFDFPGGIGPVECVNVEHEEVVLMPRWVDARRVTFKYGLGERFIDALRTLHLLGLDSTDPVTVRSASGSVPVSPRDVVAACLPDPAGLGHLMTGATCAGLWVTGTGRDGQPREVYLHHVVDNQWAMERDGVQCVAWQTAVNPIVALELLAAGTWAGVGVLGPEAFDSVPFLELLDSHGAPWALEERTPSG